MSEATYKFTRPGARSPFTGFVWPVAEWVEVDGEVALCTNGIHACRIEALPRWLDDELWRIEVDEVALEHEGVVIARRARLLDRVEAWDAEMSRELARSCAARARELAERVSDPLVRARADHIVDIAASGDPSSTALTMYTTAHTFDEVEPGTYYEERRRQAEWLRERLGLVV
jgi:hypothetical protein